LFSVQRTEIFRMWYLHLIYLGTSHVQIILGFVINLGQFIPAG
jgi:hypothetical protein